MVENLLTRNVVKHAALYIERSGAAAIIVAMHYNGPGGFLIEDEHPALLRPLPNDEELGIALAAAMQASSVKPGANHLNRKKTDWPAFKASNVRSVARFEAEFIRILVSAANEANIVYTIEGSPAVDAELRVIANANPFPSADLGRHCLTVWRACRDRRI